MFFVSQCELNCKLDNTLIIMWVASHHSSGKVFFQLPYSWITLPVMDQKIHL